MKRPNRGRPPLGRTAMTAAERQARRRKRLLEIAQQQGQQPARRPYQPLRGYPSAKAQLQVEGHQKATAKPRQQAVVVRRGLGMKALRAATTKPNGGVVGFHDENFEFHEALCPPPYPLSISRWVPPEARPAIEEMWELPFLDKDVRAALKRLATDCKMRRGVWEKLRKLLHDRQGIAEIIPSAIEALEMFALLRPPTQSKRREALQRYQQHLDKLWINHPHPTGGLLTCATSATHLRYAIESLRKVLAPTGDEVWSRYWPGDPTMNSMGAPITFLAALQDCLIAIDDEQRSDVKRFPPVVRRDHPRRHQRFFARIMSDKMQELCGRPRRDVVATLVRVAFNVDDVTTDTVREWCRKTGI